MINKFFEKIIDKKLNFGRDIIVKWCEEYINNSNQNSFKIIDIGCSRGEDLINIQTKIQKPLDMYGVEYYKPNAKIAEQHNIKVFNIDIEKEKIPIENNFFDIVIANQIIEHTKDIFWIFSEISRVIKKQGLIIIGVPNLASLHNRILLLFGKQPTSIKVLGPHVRGFTAHSFKEFIECGGYFKVLKVKSSNFYPFPSSIAKILSNIFPTLSVGLFFKIIRLEKDGDFINILDNMFFETSYFKGN